MKKSDFDINKKYTVFDKVSMEMLNWTGYDAVLLDNLVEAGNILLKENEELKNEKRDYKLANLPDFGTMVGVALAIAALGWVIIGFGHLAKSTYSNLEVAYKAGQVDVLTGERIVYEKTSRGYTVKKEYEIYKSNGSESFKIIEDEKIYYFYLEE